ncbi:MAG TPA: DinB family protein [Acidobacteriota bacterium]|nr:DinB family protein [Acidobacteriota bacterium]
MVLLEKIVRLWEHAFWADRLVADRLTSLGNPPAQAVREFAHVIAAEEVWLARLQGRPSRLAVWPSLAVNELDGVVRRTQRDFSAYLNQLGESDLSEVIDYVNSDQEAFSTPVDDILLHTALHGQYHRGKVNLILRESGHPPTACDYIAFIRGAPAATEASAQAARRKEQGNE